MKNLKKVMVLMLVCSSVFMVGCDASKIIETITKVADGIKQAAPAIKQVVDTFSSLFGNNNNNNTATAANNDNQAQAAETENTNPNAAAVVNTPTDQEDIGEKKEDTVASATQPTNEAEKKDEAKEEAKEPTSAETATATVKVSDKGRKQMTDVVEYALKNHQGGSNGQCFNAVWGYLTSSGYGNLNQWGDLPGMGSAEARNFAEFMNARPDNLKEAGLQRLDTALTPPITNPHDPRIPVGAVIVVAAGSTGTAHETAGDIVIKGNGRFINDGPNMDYGSKDTWKGKILGVYIPE